MPIHFLLSGNQNKKQELPILFSVHIKAVRFRSTAGFTIPPAKWDKAKERVKRGCSNSRGIPYNVVNAHLDKIAAFFATMEGRYLLNDEMPTKEAIKSEFAKAFNRKAATNSNKNTTLVAAYKHYMEAEGGGWSKGTAVKRRTLLHYIQEWNDKIKLDSLGEEALQSLQSFLTNEKPLSNQTISKCFNLLKTALRWAIGAGYEVNRSFETYRVKLKEAKKSIFFLTKKEINRVFTIKFPPQTTLSLTTQKGNEAEIQASADTLNRVRDMFCFCCFTGLRFSDMVKAKWTDIEGKSMHVLIQKTKGKVTIPLNAPALEILERWKEIPNAGGKIFTQ